MAQGGYAFDNNRRKEKIDTHALSWLVSPLKMTRILTNVTSVRSQEPYQYILTQEKEVLEI